MGEGFSRQSRRFDAGILCVFQGEATQSGGKRPAQAACSAYWYRFLEGLLSGGYFYLAKQKKEPLHVLTGCAWLACSVFYGLLSLREPENDIDDTILLEETENG